MNRKFSIELCSDLDFEGMVIYINYEEKLLATINYDKGIDNIEIELSFNGYEEKLLFSLENFLVALQRGKQLAIKCALEDQERDNEHRS